MRNTVQNGFCLPLLMLLLLVCVILTSCTPGHDYDEEWIIGKDATEIVERYGKFDLMFVENIEDIADSSAGYKIGKRWLFFGDRVDILLMINFNADGLAYETYIQDGMPGG